MLCWDTSLLKLTSTQITKAVDISVVPSSTGSWLPYKLDIKGLALLLLFEHLIDPMLDKHVLSEDEKKTQEYDKLAYRYVSYVAIPCLAGYTVYSMLYETHRGWYSFVISTLTSFVYMFGFVSFLAFPSRTVLTGHLQAQLIPQLIINYKLKVCAELPRTCRGCLAVDTECGAYEWPIHGLQIPVDHRR